MRFLSGTPSDLRPGLVTDVAHYRHKVFVQKLGWQLQCENALEYDQFDRAAVNRDLPFLIGYTTPNLEHNSPNLASSVPTSQRRAHVTG